MKQSLILLLLIIFFTSCEKETSTGLHLGMVPIYGQLNLENSSIIQSQPPRVFNDLGGIVERGDFIYILERFNGIHVVDNTSPSDPKTIKFWSIPGISMFTLDATKLYADCGSDLAVIDISDINSLVLVDIEKNVFVQTAAIRPPLNYSGYFECVDFSKGVVIGWETKQIKNPQCRT